MESPFPENNFPPIFRLEYEIQVARGIWEKRWMLIPAEDFRSAWESFPRWLSEDARGSYEAGLLRPLRTSSGLLLNFEYAICPDFDMPIEGIPQSYYPISLN